MRFTKQQKELYDFGTGMIGSATGLIIGYALSNYFNGIPNNPFIVIASCVLPVGLLMQWLARRTGKL